MSNYRVLVCFCSRSNIFKRGIWQFHWLSEDCQSDKLFLQYSSVDSKTKYHFKICFLVLHFAVSLQDKTIKLTTGTAKKPFSGN